MVSKTALNLMQSRFMVIAIIVISLIYVSFVAILLQAPELIGQQKDITDFDAFYIAGTIARKGQATHTYYSETFSVAQTSVSERGGFMPWTYPPPYLLLVHCLASLPIGKAYYIFNGLGLIFFLLVLRKLAGSFLPGVLIAIQPSILILLRTGQNGLYIASIIGLFFIIKPSAKGIPLGLILLKPHLAVGVWFQSLLQRDWLSVCTGVSILVVAASITTYSYGIEIWAAFLNGVEEARVFLREGLYPLHRMSSIYATAFSLGAKATIAMVLQGIGAILALSMVVVAHKSKRNTRITSSAICVASLFISPYGYDYDLAILGISAALLMPIMMNIAKTWELYCLLSLFWLSTGYGLIAESIITAIGQLSDTNGRIKIPALTSLVLIALMLFTARILRRTNDEAALSCSAQAGRFKCA